MSDLTTAQIQHLDSLGAFGCVSPATGRPAPELQLSQMVLGRLRKAGLVASERIGVGIGYERRYHTVYWLTDAGRAQIGRDQS
jgi:hypothetical protein